MVREYQTNNPFALCRQMDISVLYADLPRQVKGFFTNVDGFKMVYLNSRLPEWEQRMVCAHELGHAVLHEEINALFISYHTNLLCARYENEADYFCACLLMPDDWFLSEMEGKTVDQLAALGGVNPHLVELRLENMNRS